MGDDDWREIKALLDETGACDRAYDQAVNYVRQAQEQLARFPASRERESLFALAEYVLLRDR